MLNTYVMSLAGLDPSAGAGLLSDIKTFESLGVYGLGICTALTTQTHKRFYNLEWRTTAQIMDQTEVLMDAYPVKAAKIGLIPNQECLFEIAHALKKRNREIKIVWDPILSASSGFTFHNKFDCLEWEEVCKRLDIITPNHQELKELSGTLPLDTFANTLKRHCALLVKSCLSSELQVGDRLFTKSGNLDFYSDKVPGTEKHGSGCVLSSALAAALAHGLDLEAAVRKARAYCRRFLTSSSCQLGRHAFQGPSFAAEEAL